MEICISEIHFHYCKNHEWVNALHGEIWVERAQGISPKISNVILSHISS